MVWAATVTRPSGTRANATCAGRTDPEALVASLPDDCHRVMIASTATAQGLGLRRLPDRTDHEGRLAAFQIETTADARLLLPLLDRPGRHLYLDVEAKQDLDLLGLAADLVHAAHVHAMKPNDATVDATDALVLHHHGPNLQGHSVAVYGTGNLGFKLALRLAERRAAVQLFGRSQGRVRQASAAINAILPRHSERLLGPGGVRTFGTLVSAVARHGAVGTDWLERLEPSALVIDVGINNLTADFIRNAHDRGHTCLRLDVRAAPHPVPPITNPFFASVVGRTHIDGVPVVAGGLIGRPGEVVVDRVVHPELVIGVADGTGGLLPYWLWSAEQREEVALVEERLRATRP